MSRASHPVTLARNRDMQPTLSRVDMMVRATVARGVNEEAGAGGVESATESNSSGPHILAPNTPMASDIVTTTYVRYSQHASLITISCMYTACDFSTREH
jgi:hypothetical protein